MAGATNQITIVFNCNTDLANGDTVVIAGLTFADDDNGDYTIACTHAAMFTATDTSKAAWVN